MTTSDRISILSDGSLRIVNAQPSDQGMFTCTATNIVGSDSSTTSLSIKGQYNFITRRCSTEVCFGVEYENAWIVVTGNCSRSCAGG